MLPPRPAIVGAALVPQPARAGGFYAGREEGARHVESLSLEVCLPGYYRASLNNSGCHDATS